MGDVVIAVVDRMVAAVGFVLAAEAEVQRGDAEVLQEGGVIGARAERAEREIAARLGRFELVGVDSSLSA